MSYIIKLLEAADKELIESAKWYNDRREGQGDKFIEAVKSKLNIIREYPERYPIRKKGFHETPLKTFPYLIVYSIIEEEKLVIVNSIFHTSRQPSKKYKAK